MHRKHISKLNLEDIRNIIQAISMSNVWLTADFVNEGC